MPDESEPPIREFADRGTLWLLEAPKSKWRLSPIVPMVFYTGKRKWADAIGLASMMELPAELAAFLRRWETLFLKLRDTDAATLAQADTPIASILRALQTVDLPKEAWATVLAQVVRNLDALPETEQAQWRRAMQYLYLLVRHKREATEQDSLFAAMDEAVEQHLSEIGEIEMTGAQALVEKGRQEGRQEGQEEGRVDGQREMLIEQMSDKFGRLTDDTIARVQALTALELRRAFKSVLTATSVEEMDL